MAKFFKYKTLDMLREEVERLGVGVRLEDELRACLEPLEIGGRTVGNRFAIHPMEGCDGELDGKPGELTIRRWERFGAGGAKLIWGEATAVADEVRANTRQLLINEENLSSLADMLERTRKAHRHSVGDDSDLLIGLQLTHSGRYSYKGPLIAQHDPAVDAVTIADKKKRLFVTDDYPVLTDDELRVAGDQIVEGARLSAKAGFDFVDIKQCHRYLLSELLAARMRPGPYGGSYENRTRLAREIIGQVRDELGDRLIIASRLNVYDGAPFFQDPETGAGSPKDVETPYLGGWGTDPDNPLEPDYTEPVQYVKDMAKWGVQLLNISMGSPYYNPHVGRPFERPPIDGYTSPEHPLLGVERHFEAAAVIQEAVPNVPVIGTGYSWLQHYFANAGEANLRDGRVSKIGVGRGSLAYPDFAKDAMEKGELARTKACVAVSYCTALMRAKHNDMGQYPTGCVPRDKPYADIYKDALATDPTRDA